MSGGERLMIDKLWYLSQIKLFDKVSPEDMEEINKGTHHAKIRKHTIIQTPDMVREGLYFVKEGALRLYIVNVSWQKNSFLTRKGIRHIYFVKT
jgi:signal-transduction protein with cAMP-binding, CBS, and nucleotidyltransferase domain